MANFFATALVAVVPKATLTVNGPTKTYSSKGSSGHAVHRVFCGECGSPIAHDPDAAPEIIALKAGTLDTEIKKTLKPVSGRGAHRNCGSGGANPVRRTRRFGPSASFLSAKSTSRSHSSTCPSKNWNDWK